MISRKNLMSLKWRCNNSLELLIKEVNNLSLKEEACEKAFNDKGKLFF